MVSYWVCDRELCRYPSAVEAIESHAVSIPMLVIGSELGADCAPVESNYRKFYEAAQGPAIEIVIRDSGHFQFLDQPTNLDRAICLQGKITSSLKVMRVVHVTQAIQRIPKYARLRSPSWSRGGNRPSDTVTKCQSGTAQAALQKATWPLDVVHEQRSNQTKHRRPPTRINTFLPFSTVRCTFCTATKISGPAFRRGHHPKTCCVSVSSCAFPGERELTRHRWVSMQAVLLHRTSDLRIPIEREHEVLAGRTTFRFTAYCQRTALSFKASTFLDFCAVFCLFIFRVRCPASFIGAAEDVSFLFLRRRLTWSTE